MQLGSVPEEGRDSHSESMKGEMAESFPNGSTPEFKTNGTGQTVFIFVQLALILKHSGY